MCVCVDPDLEPRLEGLGGGWFSLWLCLGLLVVYGAVSGLKFPHPVLEIELVRDYVIWGRTLRSILLLCGEVERKQESVDCENLDQRYL